MFGCNPVDVPELPSEYDVAGEVLAIIVPDTVQIGEPFTAKISFPNVCGGQFSHFFRIDGSFKVTLTPVIHVVTQPVCPAVYAVLTETTEVQLNTIGNYEFVADGRFGQLTKHVEVVTTVPPNQVYTFRFQFQNLLRVPKPNQGAIFSFLDRTPLQTVYIQSDSLGMWDTTFVDSLLSFRYSINELRFKANRGVGEDGVFLFP